MRKRILAGAALVLAVGTFAFAEMKHGHDGHAFEMPSAQLGDLTIEHPIIRETPPNAKAAGGYIKITNKGPQDDRLIAATFAGDVAGRIELHTMEMDGDVMRMYEVEGGIALPAGATVQLAPGGLHMMFMGLQEGMTDGGHHDVILVFENAGEVTLNFAVMNMEMVRKITGADGMGHGGHNH